jgi:hypothetical protein
MPIALVVVHPFADYAKGDRITDPAEIEAHRDDRAHHVVAVNHEGEAEESPEGSPEEPSENT